MKPYTEDRWTYGGTMNWHDLFAIDFRFHEYYYRNAVMSENTSVQAFDYPLKKKYMIIFCWILPPHWLPVTVIFSNFALIALQTRLSIRCRHYWACAFTNFGKYQQILEQLLSCRMLRVPYVMQNEFEENVFTNYCYMANKLWLQLMERKLDWRL